MTTRIDRAAIALATLLFCSQASALQRHDLLGTLVIGAANGAILGVALLIYVWVWKPFRERVNAKKAGASAAKHTALAASMPKLVVLAAEGDDDAVARLLDEGADVDATGPSGQTALMLAARNGRTDVVNLLLRRGANPTARNKLGSTAADIARTYKRQRVEELITEAIKARALSQS